MINLSLQPNLIADVFDAENLTPEDRATEHGRVRAAVAELCTAFPVYP